MDDTDGDGGESGESEMVVVEDVFLVDAYRVGKYRRWRGKGGGMEVGAASGGTTRRRRGREWEHHALAATSAAGTATKDGDHRSSKRARRCGARQHSGGRTWMVGDWCDAWFHGDGMWYPAVIVSVGAAPDTTHTPAGAGTTDAPNAANTTDASDSANANDSNESTAVADGAEAKGGGHHESDMEGGCRHVQVKFVGYNNVEWVRGEGAEAGVRALSAVFRPWMDKVREGEGKGEGEGVEGSKAADSEGDGAVLAKYWDQRYRLWNRFDDGIMMDHESWYSVSPEAIAKHIAQRCACGVVVDACTGAGANAIQLAATCRSVIAVDILHERVALAAHNATVYGVRSTIDFIVSDFFALAPRLKADVVFLSPPWGGPSYLKQASCSLEALPLQHRNGLDLLHAALAITPNVVMFLPRNASVAQLRAVAREQRLPLIVERQYLNRKFKTIGAFFGPKFSRTAP